MFRFSVPQTTHRVQIIIKSKPNSTDSCFYTATSGIRNDKITDNEENTLFSLLATLASNQFRFDYFTNNIGKSCYKSVSKMPSLSDIALRVSFRRKNKPSSETALSASTDIVRPASLISAEHYDHLIAELRCPGCTRPLCAPIRLCQRGHSVCSVCYCRARACPLCAGPLSPARSLALEALADRAVFACANAQQGCPVRQTMSSGLREHEQQCAFKLGDCFMGRVWGGCDWMGRELDWLTHCQTEHANRMFESGTERVLRWQCTSYEQKPKMLAAYYIFRAYGERGFWGRRKIYRHKLKPLFFCGFAPGETFNLYQVWDVIRRRIAWTVICASKNPLVSKQYAFEVELFLPGDEQRRRHSQRHGCHGERDENVLQDGCCAAFDVGEVLRFVDAYRVS